MGDEVGCPTAGGPTLLAAALSRGAVGDGWWGDAAVHVRLCRLARGRAVGGVAAGERARHPAVGGGDGRREPRALLARAPRLAGAPNRARGPFCGRRASPKVPRSKT